MDECEKMKKKICLSLIIIILLTGSLMVSANKVSLKNNVEIKDDIKDNLETYEESGSLSHKSEYTRYKIYGKNQEKIQSKNYKHGNKLHGTQKFENNIISESDPSCIFDGQHEGNSIWYIIKVEPVDNISWSYFKEEERYDGDYSTPGGDLNRVVYPSKNEIYSNYWFDCIMGETVGGSYSCENYNLRSDPFYIIFMIGNKPNCRLTFHMETDKPCIFTEKKGEGSFVIDNKEVCNGVKDIDINEGISAWYGRILAISPLYSSYKYETSYETPSGEKKSMFSKGTTILGFDILEEGSYCQEIFSKETGMWNFEAKIYRERNCKVYLRLIAADMTIP